jgi:3-hydroxy-9,10-secoandrosta-1,3,5(10)-triene-9,17-dione monooxygenase
MICLDRPGMSLDELRVRADLVATASELVPLLRSNAARTENDRRLADECIDALREAGLFKLAQPKQFGGLETDVRTRIEVVRALARGCGSTAWVTSLMTGGAWFVGMCSDELRDDVWGATPDARVCGVTALTGTAAPVDGGFRVSGRWGYCSGSLHAQWFFLGVTAVDSNGNTREPGVAFVPLKDVSIEDSWYMAGLRGTGSNTVVVREVLVPHHRFIPVSAFMSGVPAAARDRGSIYRAPFASSAATDLLGTQLGLADATMELVLADSRQRGLTGTIYDVRADAPTAQLAIANAAASIEIAELLAYGVAADVDAAGEKGIFPDLVGRTRNKMRIAQSIVHARDAIRTLMSLQGSGGFAESSPLQRMWRDSEVGSRHAVCDPAVASEAYGRALFGVTATVAPFV